MTSFEAAQVEDGLKFELCGMRGCVGWEVVWDGRLCGMRGCVGWEVVWGVRLCGQ